MSPGFSRKHTNKSSAVGHTKSTAMVESDPVSDRWICSGAASTLTAARAERRRRRGTGGRRRGG